MKTLSVKKVNDSAITSAEQIPTIFDIEQIPFNQIDCINWKDYPYHPDVKFRIAHTGNAILLHYCITEQSVRATAPEDNGRVWEDSCAEFFVQPGTDNQYYNFECNCAGTLLIEYGKPGNREHAPLETVGQVMRWASLGRTDAFSTYPGVRSMAPSGCPPLMELNFTATVGRLIRLTPATIEAAVC